MSIISFQTFCVEFYRQHLQKPSDEVYALFKASGLLDLLQQEYADLHGMGMEYMMQFIDDYRLPVINVDKRDNPKIEHHFVRALLIPEIVKMIAAHWQISEQAALERFYASATGGSFADEKTGLYGQSALYVYGLFLEEQESNDG